jgi:hypothetical protein
VLDGSLIQRSRNARLWGDASMEIQNRTFFISLVAWLLLLVLSNLIRQPVIGTASIVRNASPKNE